MLNAPLRLAGFLTVILLAMPGRAPAAATSQSSSSDPPRLTIQGTQLLTPDGRPIRLRGFNLLWWVPPTARDVTDIKELGANCVRYQFGYIPRGRFDPHQLRWLKRHVQLATSQGLWVIPNVHTFIPREGSDGADVWTSPDVQREFLDMWEYVLNELKDEPFIAAWEPINEPHAVDRKRLAPWYREIIPHFRRIDPHTPLVVEGAEYSGAEELLDHLKLDDPSTIYSFHFYHPHEYTHMRHPPDKSVLEYPGRWGRIALAQRMATAIRFRDRYQVPVFCGEWGVMTGAPGYQQWMHDVAGLLEEYELPWTHWAWAVQRRGAINDTFDVNRQKIEIYGIIGRIFKATLARDAGLPLDRTTPRPSTAAMSE